MLIRIGITVAVHVQSRSRVEVIGTPIGGIIDLVCCPIKSYTVENDRFFLWVDCLRMNHDVHPKWQDFFATDRHFHRYFPMKNL
jgi:hypothetical protein